MTTNTNRSNNSNLFSELNLKIIIIMSSIAFAMLFLAGCSKNVNRGDVSKTTYDNYDTYAFFGTDSRAEEDKWKTDSSTGTEGAPSSDVIMLLTVNGDNQDVRIISIYRDMMMDIAGDGSDFEKCNAAFRIGGAYGAIDMLEKNLDLRIDGYVTANFMSVAKAIDMLGGVDVDVEDMETETIHKNAGDDVVDVMNNYIDEMNKIYDSNTPHVEQPGKQTLTGLQAVAYSRVRYTAGKSIRRTGRQRNVVALMAEKLKDSDSEMQKEVLKEMYKTVDTDLTESEMMKLFDLLIDYELGEMDGFPFKLDQVNDPKKGALLVPCSLESNVKSLHAFLYNNDEYEPNITVTEYSKLITEETGLDEEDANEEISAY